MKVAVLAGGRSSEHEVSLSSAAAVRNGVEAAGHEVIPITIERDGRWLVDGAPLTLTPGEGLLGADVVFPVLHGPFGEDGTLQGLLELLDIPYVGAGVFSSSICMDKVAFKRMLATSDLPHIREYEVVLERDWREDPYSVGRRVERLGLPIFVKPARLGSSVGIVKVTATSELHDALAVAFRHDSMALVEVAATGVEVEVAVMGLGSPDVTHPGEISLSTADWYDYEAKYTPGGMELIIPARISDAEADEIKRIAREVFIRVDCAGLARIDFFVDNGKVLLNELNTMPGFTQTSVFPKLWQASGLEFSELCDCLLGYALKRYWRDRAGHEF